MPNEVLIYSMIFDFTAESFINQINEFDGEDVTIRFNSPGGDVLASWGMVAKSQEHDGDILIKVDGQANSMAAIFLLFHSNVEALDVSKFTLHRASSFRDDEGTLKMLGEINKEIRSAFEKKLNIPEFERISGVTLDEFFNSDNVIDVNLNAKQAKKIGLISKINKVDAAEFQALDIKFAAVSATNNNKEKNISKPKNNKTMNIEELKSKHPDVYAKVFTLGKEDGIKAESDRTGSWMVHVDANSKIVAEGIKSGDPLTATAQAELMKASFAASTVKDTEEDNAPDVDTDTPEDGGDATVVASTKFDADVLAELGINKK